MALEVISRQPKNQTHETPLLFIHGVWHGAWCWDQHFLPYFADHGYAAHAVSLRGHGGSPNDKPIRRTRLKDYVADALATARSMEPHPVLIGHSMGGAVVQHALHEFDAPAAVLLASLPPSGLMRGLLKTAWAYPLPFLKTNLLLDPQPIVATPDRYRWQFFSKSFPEAQLREYHACLKPESYMVLLDMTLFALPRPGNITTPMLVLGAANDNAFSPRQVEETATAYHAETQIFPNIAHAMMLEAGWQQVADRMLAWLAERGL